MNLSIVTTIYNSESYLAAFYQRIVSVARKITEEYEIIFVDDGSPDNSMHVVSEIALKDSRVKLIELSRNFGHHQAILSGLSHATGEMVFLIDCDLEEPPELLEKFYSRMLDQQPDVVYGVQERRKGGIGERITGMIFYKLFNMLSTIKIPQNVLTVRLMKKRYVDALLMFNEKVISLAGIWSAVGFKQIPCIVQKASKGLSSYTFTKKIKLAVDSITSFSEKPLIYVFSLGVIVSFISFFYILYIFGRKIFFHVGIVGWSSLMASIWLFGGLILLSLGLIGMYVARIYLECKERPRVIVKEIVQGASNSCPSVNTEEGERI